VVEVGIGEVAVTEGVGGVGRADEAASRVVEEVSLGVVLLLFFLG